MELRKVLLPLLASTLTLTGLMTGCAHRRALQAEQEAVDAQKGQTERDQHLKQIEDLKALVSSLSSKVENLEGKLSNMNDKVDSTRTSLDSFAAVHDPASSGKMKLQGVAHHPADGMGAAVQSIPASNDPESGFVADSAIQTYRKAMVQFEAQKYADAIIGFSSFLEQYPDHALAGAAQYRIGLSYFQQKEYKPALQELQRVLTSYDRSSHVSDTLAKLAETEDALHLSEAAARHRQLLTSLFAASPAAEIALAAKPAAVEAQEAPQAAPKPDAPASKLDEPPPPTAPIETPQPEASHHE